MKDRKIGLVNLLFLVLTLVVNGLGAMGFINGYSQKMVSDLYGTLITPAAFTFSIWSVIYLLLFIYVIVVIVKGKDSYYGDSKVAGLFVLSCVLNMAWIVAFAYLQMAVSAIIILMIACVLNLINKRLLAINEGGHWLAPLTFGLYSGWLVIATVVNVSSMLVQMDFNGFGLSYEVWAMIMLGVSVLLVILLQLNNRNVVYAWPVAWAYFGIYSTLKAGSMLANIALVGLVVMVLFSFLLLVRNKFKIIPVK
ncbi:MAG: TspO/MBR family protein [Erysipelotrichaceae bacterium]